MKFIMTKYVSLNKNNTKKNEKDFKMLNIELLFIRSFNNGTYKKMFMFCGIGKNLKQKLF